MRNRIDLEAIRFGPERECGKELLPELLRNPASVRYNRAEVHQNYREGAIAKSVRVDCGFSPRLSSLLDQVVSKLGVSFRAELFVFSYPDTLIFTLADASSEGTAQVFLSSRVVELMTNRELMFLLAHELAHHAFGHGQFTQLMCAINWEEGGEVQLSPMLVSKLQEYDLMMDVSSDRAGLLATGMRIETAISALVKLTTGLSPKHLGIRTRKFLNYLVSDADDTDALQELKPILAARVIALCTFVIVSRKGRSMGNIDECDPIVMQKVFGIDGLDGSVSVERLRDFLFSGGVLALCSDGAGLTTDTCGRLVESIETMFIGSDVDVMHLADMQQTQDTFANTCDWLRTRSEKERFNAYSMLLSIAAQDGRISEEREFHMRRVAEVLDVPLHVHESMLAGSLVETGNWLNLEP